MWIKTSLFFPEDHLTLVTLMGGRAGAGAPAKTNKHTKKAMAVKVEVLLEDLGLEIEFVSIIKKVHNRNMDQPPTPTSSVLLLR